MFTEVVELYEKRDEELDVMFATVAESYRNEELYDPVEVEPQGHTHMDEASTILEVAARKTTNHIKLLMFYTVLQKDYKECISSLQV